MIQHRKDYEPTEEGGLVAARRGDVPDEAHTLTTNVVHPRVLTGLHRTENNRAP
jgi:hypothetical protein